MFFSLLLILASFNLEDNAFSALEGGFRIRLASPAERENIAREELERINDDHFFEKIFNEEDRIGNITQLLRSEIESGDRKLSIPVEVFPYVNGQQRMFTHQDLAWGSMLILAYSKSPSELCDCLKNMESALAKGRICHVIRWQIVNFSANENLKSKVSSTLLSNSAQTLIDVAKGAPLYLRMEAVATINELVDHQIVALDSTQASSVNGMVSNAESDFNAASNTAQNEVLNLLTQYIFSHRPRDYEKVGGSSELQDVSVLKSTPDRDFWSKLRVDEPTSFWWYISVPLTIVLFGFLISQFPKKGTELIPPDALPGQSSRGKLPKVFVSYSTRDQRFVQWLIGQLHQEGLDVWIDMREIAVGDSIVDKIGEGLASASYLIAVLSSNSVKSGWVKDELGYAFFREKTDHPLTILPLLVDKCEIPPLLKSRKFADFSIDRSRGLEELLTVLNREREVFNSELNDFSRATVRTSQAESLASLGRGLLQLSQDQLIHLANSLNVKYETDDGRKLDPDELVDGILQRVEDRQALNQLMELLAKESPEALPGSTPYFAPRLAADIAKSDTEVDSIFLKSLSEQIEGVHSKRWRLLRVDSAYDFTQLKLACEKADASLTEVDQARGQQQKTMLFVKAIYQFAVYWTQMIRPTAASEQFVLELSGELARSVLLLKSPIDSSNIADFLSYCKTKQWNDVLKCLGIEPPTNDQI